MQQGDKAQFYNDTKAGWFWYHDPAPEPEEDQQQEQKKPPMTRQLPSLDQYTVQELWDMYPDDFQELLNVVQKKAVQRPTEKNITEYLTMQDIARRKALAYASASVFVMQKRADLFSTAQVYPTNSPGMTARRNQIRSEISSTIRAAAGNYALLFFVRKGCGFCDKQAAILKFFVEKYQWEIKPIDISRNVTAASRFNITVTPTLLLIKRGEERYMPISTGVSSFQVLEKNIYRAIRFLSGKTKEKNYLLYEFEKGSPADPDSILQRDRPRSSY